ncbi:MAG TPA: Ser-Thr-rich GPI-anchored membrane family protein [Chitinispirillaceae bacterium]|nr:Ser-Thr-rich GPI-anchored membrane family protein [Chitinispirillaceae bacterium]
MKARMKSFTLALLVFSLILFIWSCDDSDEVNPVSAVDHYGYVEGIIRLEGKPLDSVNITARSSSTFSSKTLSKQAVEQPEINDSMGYYKLVLLEGTYDITFLKYMPARTVRLDKFATVTAGKTLKLDVNFNELLDTLTFVSAGAKSVSISWPPYASYYQVYRSIDSIHWSFVPGIQTTSVGKKLIYTVTYPPALDTVPDYGSYYYKVCGFSSSDSLTFQTTVKKYTVENTPPAIKSVLLADSVRYLYGNILLNSGYADYRMYSVVVLRSDMVSIQFSNYDTIAGNKLLNNVANPIQYFLRDSVCDTGYYAFRFYAIDNITGKSGDTTNVYSVHYKKMVLPPTLSLTDYPQYVQININRNIYTREIFQILRATDDTSKAVVIDTIPLTSSIISYQDYTADDDTCYYAVQQLCGNETICSRSNFYGIIHNTTPLAPSLFNPADSGVFVCLQYYTPSTGFPIVIFRASAKDTLPIDTIVPFQTTTSIYRDYPPKSGYYSYAMAHLGTKSILGKMSVWTTVYFRNAPVTPVVTVTQVNGSCANIKVSNINNISGMIIKRTESLTGTVQKTDTIYSSQFGYYNITSTNPQSLIILDTVKTPGSYFYIVNTFNINGSLSRDATAGLYIPAQLPPPLSPTVSTSDLCITISVSSAITSSTADSLSIYKSKDSLTSFALLQTIPVTWSTSFADSVYKTGSGRYYYKIKIIKGGISSETSAPVEIYYSGLLTSPDEVKLGADSSTIKVIIPLSNVPFDSMILYRAAAGSSEFVQVVKLDSTANKGSIFIDSVRQNGGYTYKTRIFYKTLFSRFSAEKSISVPGIGYKVFSTPSADDSIKTGTTFQIKFNSRIIDGTRITVYLYKESTRIQSIASISISSENASYSWNVPSTITAGNGYHLEMFDYYSDELIDRSAEFVIAAAQ